MIKFVKSICGVLCLCAAMIVTGLIAANAVELIESRAIWQPALAVLLLCVAAIFCFGEEDDAL